MKFIIKLKGTVLCLFILFITGTGCDSRIAITEGKQSRTENCGRGFDTWQASNETAAYVIEKTVAADEESARDLVRNMMDIGGYEDIDINCFRAIELDKGNAGVLTGIVSLNKKKEAAEKIRSRYQEAGGSVEPKEFNHGLFQDILAAAMIQEDGIEPITGRNEYPLYESFVKYLAERYSTEQVIDAVTKEKSIEEAFGKHFQELQQEWITKISQKGGVAK